MLRLERLEEFAILTIDRPRVHNALNFELLRAIDKKLDEIDSWDVRTVVITGTGEKAFCAGADIPELKDRDMQAERRGSRLGQMVFDRIAHFRVPTIAAINGYAFGGGLEMALACTFRVAVESSQMGLPEIKLGLIPGYGGTQRLPRLIGAGRALELIMTGRTVSATEAYQMGLVNRVVEDNALAAAKDFAREYTCYGLPALELARDAVCRGQDLPIDEGLRLEAELSTLAYRSEDGQIGLSAFIEKRTPEFFDR